jgi:hypothetical protein
VPIALAFPGLSAAGSPGTGVPFSVDDGGGVMNAIQHAVALPPEEVVIHRAAWRKILRKIAPLTTGAQDIRGAALAAAGPRRWNEWRNNRPLLVCEVAWYLR